MNFYQSLKLTRTLSLFFTFIVFLSVNAIAQNWNTSGNNIYNNNGGNVGVGESTPTAKLHVFAFDKKNGDFDLFHVGTEGLTVGGMVDLPRFVVKESGNVGLGEDTPQHLLHLNSGKVFVEGMDGAFQVANPANVGATVKLDWKNNIARIRYGGNGTGATGGFQIQGQSDKVKLHIDDDGGIGIGTSDLAAGYMLSVKGKVMAEEVRVQLFDDWPDYVFSEEYERLDLDSLQSYIDANHHLPGIPAAEQVEKEGIMVGEMQVRMMEKIEELTLYLLELKQENDALRDDIEALKPQ